MRKISIGDLRKALDSLPPQVTHLAVNEVDHLEALDIREQYHGYIDMTDVGLFFPDSELYPDPDIPPCPYCGDTVGESACGCDGPAGTKP